MSRAAPESKANGRHVVIVGGGIAGIAAALRLVEHGARVTMLETRRKLGGRATSFDDVRTGLTIDNCQHVLMGCCTNFIDLLRRLGRLEDVQWHREIYWVEAGGHISRMVPGVLPAPAHFTGSFVSLKFLSLGEKIAIGRAMSAMLRVQLRSVRQLTFGRWLELHGQSEDVVRRFWAPIVVSACNLHVDRVAASVAIHVFQEGFLANRDSAMLGVPRVPLVRLYDRAAELIRHSGGEVLLGRSVESVGERGVRCSDGAEFGADAVICALPPERAARVASPQVALVDDRFERAGRLDHSPILGVHLTFDRPVMPLPHAVLVDRPTQWLFRKDQAGEHVHAVISAADDWMELDEEEITHRVLKDLRACFPDSRRAEVRSSRPVKEKRATFAPTTDSEALRASTQGKSSVILAGDYVQTGWPATMEGATRSGYMAAAAAMGHRFEEYLVPSLEPALCARLLGAQKRSAPADIVAGAL